MFNFKAFFSLFELFTDDLTDLVMFEVIRLFGPVISYDAIDSTIYEFNYY